MTELRHVSAETNWNPVSGCHCDRCDHTRLKRYTAWLKRNPTEPPRVCACDGCENPTPLKRTQGGNVSRKRRAYCSSRCMNRHLARVWVANNLERKRELWRATREREGLDPERRKRRLDYHSEYYIRMVESMSEADWTAMMAAKRAVYRAKADARDAARGATATHKLKKIR